MTKKLKSNLLAALLDTSPNLDTGIGSCDDLVPSGNKPLPEPMMTQIYVTIWRHLATMN